MGGVCALRKPSPAGERASRVSLPSIVKRTMQAAWEGKDNHTRHVENQIAYADAVAEAAFERMKAWVMAELPGLIQKELSKPQSQVKIQAKVDEKSLSEAKRKISDMFKSIFR